MVKGFFFNMSLTKNETTFKDSRDRECDEKPEENEHQVVDRECGDDRGQDLDEDGPHHGRPPTELVRGPPPHQTPDKDTPHVASLDCRQQRQPLTHQRPLRGMHKDCVIFQIPHFM